MTMSLILAAGGAFVDLSQGVALLGLITFLATASTVVGYGIQRGRIATLEKTAELLRKDLGDEQNRRKTDNEELKAVRAEAAGYHDEVTTLTAQVNTMTAFAQGVEGPIARLAQIVEATNALLVAHNTAAMDRIGEVRQIGLDTLQLLGDQRTRKDKTNDV